MGNEIHVGSSQPMFKSAKIQSLSGNVRTCRGKPKARSSCLRCCFCCRQAAKPSGLTKSAATLVQERRFLTWWGQPAGISTASFRCCSKCHASTPAQHKGFKVQGFNTKALCKCSVVDWWGQPAGISTALFRSCSKCHASTPAQHKGVEGSWIQHQGIVQVLSRIQVMAVQTCQLLSDAAASATPHQLLRSHQQAGSQTRYAKHSQPAVRVWGSGPHCHTTNPVTKCAPVCNLRACLCCSANMKC